MAVYGYTRVSTDRQASDGDSLDVQRRTIAGYAMMHGLEVSRFFIEKGVSGSTPLGGRGEGGVLLSVARRGDTIITAKLDRMFRSALDALSILEKFRKIGVALHMIDLGGDVVGDGTNYVGKLVFSILSAVAEAERDRIRHRIAEVKQDQKSRGRYLGGIVPFGFTKGENGNLIPYSPQQNAINDALGMRRNGASIREIQTMLGNNGHKLSLGAVHKLVRPINAQGERGDYKPARVQPERHVAGG